MHDGRSVQFNKKRTKKAPIDCCVEAIDELHLPSLQQTLVLLLNVAMAKVRYMQTIRVDLSFGKTDGVQKMRWVSIPQLGGRSEQHS